MTGLYQPSILRPPNSLNVPKDISRGTFAEKEQCSWPCFAGSNFQEWCDPSVASKYYGMRPVITYDEYQRWLYIIFDKIVDKSSEISLLRKNQMVWEPVFCNNSKSAIMNHIMGQVALAVSKSPELNNNGPYKVEQFFYTDEQIFQFAIRNETGTQIYYDVVFNLYNPLRSMSSFVEVVMMLDPLTIVYANLVNKGSWKSTQETLDGISGYNVAKSGSNLQIDLTPGPKPTQLEWSYGNTLLKQDFNEFGFFKDGENVKIKAGVPENLKNRMRTFEAESKSYLLPCADVKFTGIKTMNNKMETPNGVPRTVYNNPKIVYNKGNFGFYT